MGGRGWKNEWPRKTGKNITLDMIKCKKNNLNHLSFYKHLHSTKGIVYVNTYEKSTVTHLILDLNMTLTVDICQNVVFNTIRAKHRIKY